MTYFKYLAKTTVQIVKNLRRIWSLALFEYKLSNKDLFFGFLWKIISPFMQIGVYWLVFGLGLRNGSPRDGFPYIVWLTCGITPWYMVSRCVSSGSRSVFQKASLLTRSNIPTALIPISCTVSAILENVFTVLLMLVIFLCNGCILPITAFGIFYYIFFMLCFCSSLALVTSVLCMLARDFSKLQELIMRLMFFLSPVIWIPSGNMPAAFLLFDKINPFAYIIRGFRNSMLYQVPFYEDVFSMVFFWGVTILLYMLGIGFHRKLKNKILDYI